MDLLWKIKKDWLKNETRDRFLNNSVFYVFLVCALYKEPIKVINFDTYILKINLSILKGLKFLIIKVYKNRSTCKN